MKKITTYFTVALALVAFTTTTAQSVDAVVGNPNPEVSQTATINHYPNRGGVLFDNGPLITDPGPPAESLLENNTVGVTLLGTSFSSTGPFSVADDATFATAVSITSVDFYGYQTGAPSASSSLQGVALQIWDGDPSDPGSSVITGDLTTDISSGTSPLEVFRFSETAGFNMDRAINIISAQLPSAVELPAGTYWFEWTVTGDPGFSGPWCPPVTVLGSSGPADANALQNSGGVYSPVLSGANDEFPQAVPFTVNGTEIVLGVDSNLLDQVSIFPNPTQDRLNIAVPSTVEVKNAVLYDVLGKDTGIRLSNGTMDTSNLARGVYILNLETSAGSLSEKVVKR